MCVCRKDNYSHCFNFQSKLLTCDSDWCNHRGICVKNHQRCPTYSRCICKECFYGPFCQFSSAAYILSLSDIIGSHIDITDRSFFKQSKVTQTAVILISSVVILGIILNALSISTFIQRETHLVGCGLYLLTSSIIGLMTAVMLISKMIFLLRDIQNIFSCIIVEYFLIWCSSSCEWLNASVAFERTIAVKRGTQYSRSKSKYVAKWMTPIILLLLALICIPELFSYKIVRTRNLCISNVNDEQPDHLKIHRTLHVFLFIIPLLINLLSSVIIISSILESKQRTTGNILNNTQQSITWGVHLKLIQTQILKHKHILIGPILLSLLSLPRPIFTFITVCTVLDRHAIQTLLAYLVGFFPSMAIIFAFIWPSQAYRSALRKFINTIIRKS
jgi:hypothetical protein